MSLQLNPYLTFTDDARAALNFYHETLGGDLTVSTFADFQAPVDEKDADKVMHGQLATPHGLLILASDGGIMDAVPRQIGNPQVEVALLGSAQTDEQEARGWFEGLSQGGEVTMPLEKAPWGDVFGSFTDKFGVRWMINLEAPKA
ncbi:VOC family protein [uncultured Kocuria sp.]|uniref:VOC family protein n=1 Tax=uncultured Kocuria sp. TaxID=259305 RepID=UPI002594B89A|nr:VOC family protein [uncultured Kocuria sp.]MCT1368088.1 VOC family protein [Rothia sp. p3-SID1597]